MKATHRTLLNILLLCSLLLHPSPAWADDPAYAPDIAEFDGQSAYGFAAHEAFLPDSQCTIEFWVAAGWQDGIAYDPVILSLGSIVNPALLVALMEEKDGLVLLINEQEIVAAHDFSNGKLHHVAIVWDQEALGVVINGQVLEVTDSFYPAGDLTNLWIGSFFGEDLTFIGSIGQMRFWSDALDLETIRKFALHNISTEITEHPNLPSLKAMSLFTDNTILIVDDVK